MNILYINLKGWVVIKAGQVVDTHGYLQGASKIINLVTNVLYRGNNAFILLDFTKTQELASEIEAYAIDVTRDLKFKKFAIFGIKPQFAQMIDNIIEKSTRGNDIRKFETKEEAEKWLTE